MSPLADLAKLKARLCESLSLEGSPVAMVLSLQVEITLGGGGRTLPQGLHIRCPADQLFTLRFIPIAKLVM